MPEWPTSADDELSGLIVRYKSGEVEAASNISARIYEIVGPIVRRFKTLNDPWEDLLLETTHHILDRLKTSDVEKPLPWINKASKDFLRDKYRKEHSKKGQVLKAIRGVNPIVDEGKGISLIETLPDPNAAIPGDRNFYESSEEEEISNFYRTKIPADMRKGIDTALKYIVSIYRYKEQFNSAKARGAEFQRLAEVFRRALTDIRYVSGRGIKKKAERYEYFAQKDAFSIFFDRAKLPDSEKRELEEFDRMGWHRLPIKAYYKINTLLQDTEIGMFFDCYPEKDFLTAIRSLNLIRDDISRNIPKLRVEPPRLFYDVLAGVFRSGKKSDGKGIRLVLAYLKTSTQRTDKEILFSSIPVDGSSFESLRTGRYRKPGPGSRRFYKGLVSTIAKKSFGEFEQPPRNSRRGKGVDKGSGPS